MPVRRLRRCRLVLVCTLATCPTGAPSVLFVLDVGLLILVVLPPHLFLELVQTLLDFEQLLLCQHLLPELLDLPMHLVLLAILLLLRPCLDFDLHLVGQQHILGIVK